MPWEIGCPTLCTRTFRQAGLRAELECSDSKRTPIFEFKLSISGKLLCKSAFTVPVNRHCRVIPVVNECHMHPFSTKDIVNLSLHPSLVIVLHRCTVIEVHLEESLGFAARIFQVDIEITPESFGVGDTENTVS